MIAITVLNSEVNKAETFVSVINIVNRIINCVVYGINHKYFGSFSNFRFRNILHVIMASRIDVSKTASQTYSKPL